MGARMADSTTTLDDELAAAVVSGDVVSDTTTAPPPVLPLRYTDGRLIARGGMGDVWSFRDDVLGRNVAIKVLARKRNAVVFEREARIQARLTHPAVVPIHDIGDSDGTPYLVMSQIDGETLARILERHRSGDPRVRARYNRRQLLTSYVRVCQALAHAHRRGVIHRDLKPDNIILGVLGEVYVLDWGIAVLSDPDTSDVRPTRGLVGTLGYMAPEQLVGEGFVDRRADVYALGAILFEIVTGAPLHPGTERSELIASTACGVDVAARAMAEQAVLPPELEAVCRRATAIDPEQRYDSVDELVAELERFLDGERDEAGRRALADELVDRARSKLGSEHTRKDVLRDAGRALALAPGHEEASAILRRALAHGEDVLPPELASRLAADDRNDRRRGAVIGLAALTAWLLLFSFSIRDGVREPVAVIAFLIAIAITALAALQRAIWGGTNRRAGMVGAIAGGIALLALARLTGPYLVLPTIAVAVMPIFPFDRPDHRRWLFVIFAAAMLLPWLAESLRWIDPTTVVDGDALVIRGKMAPFKPASTPILLALVSFAALAIAHTAVGRMYRMINENRLARARSAWQLEQVLPERLDDPPS